MLLFQLRHFALRLILSHIVFLPICRVVYFRCGVKLTYSGSKIDVRRLKVEDLLIQILVQCITRSSIPCSRDQRTSSPATASH